LALKERIAQVLLRAFGCAAVSRATVNPVARDAILAKESLARAPISGNGRTIQNEKRFAIEVCRKTEIRDSLEHLSACPLGGPLFL
jgi:hypothetical protein